jgi:hypothetical protein
MARLLWLSVTKIIATYSKQLGQNGDSSSSAPRESVQLGPASGPRSSQLTQKVSLIAKCSNNPYLSLGIYGESKLVRRLTLIADRHREFDLPLSRAIDLVYQKCTISREGR